MSFGERFLRFPDLFPGRPSGEPWGDEALGLDFPGVPLEVSGLSCTQAEEIAAHFGTVISTADPGDTGACRMRVFRAPLSDFTSAESQPLDLDFEYRESASLVAGWHLMARFDWTPRLAASLWTPHQAGKLLTSAFENLCRALVAYRLAETGGALIHSSAAADGASARLFVGSSGAGKTTVWSLLQQEGIGVLCDDLNSLYRDDGAVVVSSTPFSTVSSMRENPIRHHRLGEILFLRQGTANNKRQLSPSEALGRLFSNAPFVNRDRHREENLFDTLAPICHELPAAELTFTMERGLWAWLEGDRETEGHGS